MVKLTADLILHSQQRLNPVKDYELNLRGYKIPVIENLGATLDQFDTLDMSDNEIRKLEGFPLLNRLSSLLLSNNRISRITEGLHEQLPKLRTLILSNNQLAELGDIDPLVSIKTLHTLSLLRNPVCTKKQYRLYVIRKLPQVKVLDFRKVRLKERREAGLVFKGTEGERAIKQLGKKSKTFTPGQPLPTPTAGAAPVGGRGMGADERNAIKRAIAEAKSLEEVERLSQMLRSGHIPGKMDFSAAGGGQGKKRGQQQRATGGGEVTNGDVMEEEEEEDVEEMGVDQQMVDNT